MRRSWRHLGLLWLLSGAFVFAVAVSNLSAYWIVVGPLLLALGDVVAGAMLAQTRLRTSYREVNRHDQPSAVRVAEFRMAEAEKRQHRADWARKEAEVDWRLAQAQLRAAHEEELRARTEARLALFFRSVPKPAGVHARAHQLVPELEGDQLALLNELLDRVERAQASRGREQAERAVVEQVEAWLASPGEGPS